MSDFNTGGIQRELDSSMTNKPDTSSNIIPNSSYLYISTATLICSIFVVIVVVLFIPFKENVVCCDGGDYNTAKRLAELELRIETMQALLDKTSQDKLKTKYSGPSPGSGTTYVRWGRTACPNSTDTMKVYEGFAAGDWYQHQGGGTELLCLPSDPSWGKYSDIHTGHAYLYGTEYQVNKNGDSARLFNKEMHDHNVPCTVCHSVGQSVKLMIPGRFDCYDGWREEYKGYLMTGHHGHAKSTDYSCVDMDPESVQGNAHNQDGRLLYLVEASCKANSLPCPPYVDGRNIACVVCTK